MTKNFSKPTVKEIVCQFRFSLEEDNPWTSKKPGELLKLLGDDYPNLETPQEVGVGIHLKEGSVTPELLAPRQRLIYSNDSGNCSIVVMPDSFAFIYKVNEDYNYSSWGKSFEPLLTEAWKSVKDCLAIKKIKSIGIRYINHIDQSYGIKLHETLDSESDYIPTAIVSEHQGFFNRSEIALDKQNRIVIQAGTACNPEDESDKIVILDIDQMYEGEIDVTEDTLPSNLNEIQKKIEDVFFSSISSALKEKME